MYFNPDHGASAPIPPPDFVMPNVIDSLKRLERIGSEGSETVRKILEAADQVGKKIVSNADPSLYGLCFTGIAAPNGVVDFIRVPSGESISSWAGATTDCHVFCRYIITELALLVDGFDGKFKEVSADRESALRLSKDISNGLLDLFAVIQQEYTPSDKRHSQVKNEADPYALEAGFEVLQSVLSKPIDRERPEPVPVNVTVAESNLAPPPACRPFLILIGSTSWPL